MINTSQPRLNWQAHHARVYYEDTDTAGIVYYANYLRFLERGRTEFLRKVGFQQRALMDENISFAVTSVSANYLKPARLDDLLEVKTAIGNLRRAQLIFAQEIWCGDTRLLDAKIGVACIDPRNGKPIAIRRDIHDQFKRWSTAPAGANPELKQ
jgi:acyl-CoA thioester hydrolase